MNQQMKEKLEKVLEDRRIEKTDGEKEHKRNKKNIEVGEILLDQFYNFILGKTEKGEKVEIQKNSWNYPTYTVPNKI